jgi:hypothetical protein
LLEVSKPQDIVWLEGQQTDTYYVGGWVGTEFGRDTVEKGKISFTKGNEA